MNRGFWDKLPRPFFILAPMADVTDAAFRRVIAKYGKPDVFFTEFVSVDGLMSAGREKLLLDFKYTEGERPIVAQIFGAKPDLFEPAAALCAELGFDGIDINMGCPDRAVLKQGACAALIENPKAAQEIVRRTKAGAPHLPVSVKTRIGLKKPILESWLPALLEVDPAVITIHARTAKELSLVPAKWEYVAKAVEMAKGSNTLIVGNGDVRSVPHARELAAQTGADGVMLGRAIFGNPFLFNQNIDPASITLEQKLSILLEHAELFEELLGVQKNFAIMRKHFGAYVKGFRGAAEIRMKLMACANPADMREVIASIIKNPPIE